jgi:hypothetical protein
VRTSLLPRGRAAALTVFVAIAAIGCSSASPYTSFDPATPCVTDGRFPGAYPDLEARVPKQFDGRAPDQLDSGRNCSVTEMGTLAGHGVTELHYAGGTWVYSANAGVTLAVFTGAGLTAEWLGEWYESGARSATNTRNITPTRPMIAGRQGYRLDTVNGESNQVVITWPSPNGDAAYVLVAADVAAAKIDEALATFP